MPNSAVFSDFQFAEVEQRATSAKNARTWKDVGSKRSTEWGPYQPPLAPAGRVDKDERYLRDLLNKSTAAAQKQQQAVVVESSELLNHIQ